MCLLTYLPADVMPDTRKLTDGAEWNDDGSGYAIVAGDDILTGRDMDGTDLVARFATVRERYRGPALFHSRMATHGSKGLDNCHPFHATAGTVVAHNGILPVRAQPAKGDHRSDTRKFVEDLFGEKFRGGLTRRSRRQLAEWMGIANKIVILTTDRRYSRSAYIVNEQAGHWKNGAWWSNDSYDLLSRWAHEPNVTGWVTDMPHVSPCCLVCGARTTMVTGDVCPVCWSCQDCGQDAWKDCLCYTPRTHALGASQLDAEEDELA